MKQRDLTEGGITGNLLLFALPLMAGNLLQQCYNIADTLIVGRYLGANALAAVGSSYTLMTFSHLPSAVHYEFRNSDGTGKSKQFRNRSYGCFCSCCEN